MYKIHTYEQLDRSEWAEFVKTHPNGNVFQTPEMYEVYARTKHTTPFVVAVSEGNEIVGVLLAQIITNGGRFASWLTARSIIIGGPLIKDERADVLNYLMDAYKQLLPRKIIYSEIRPIYDMADVATILQGANWKRKGHYNLLMSLDKSPEELFEQMHKERRRNVNQAIKAGLVFREVTERNDVRAIVELIRKTYERKHVPISYLDMFEEVHEQMKQYAHFFASYTSDGIMIAGEVRLCYKDLIYAWFAGSDEDYFKLRPNDFTMWNVICWGSVHGYKLLDFGGGGEPGVPYGVRDYKLKYGCEIYDYGRYVYAHRPVSLWAGTIAYKLYHKIKGK